MKLVTQLKDKVKRHQERHRSLAYRHVIAESIDFVDHVAWSKLTRNRSVFLSAEYLSMLENNSPENTEQRYAIAYDGKEPVAAIVCQIAEIQGGHLTQVNNDIQQKVVDSYRERILVCGNLVSSGLHGVAFAEHLDESQGWRIVSEILYKIRCVEKLHGKINFSMLKDIKGEILHRSSIMERYSYRSVQTDPDMVLTLKDEVSSFEGYLSMLTSRYRSRARKIIKNVAQAGYECKKLEVTPELDAQLYPLYLQVENRSSISLASLPQGAFSGLARTLGDDFCCYAISKEDQVAGFISIVKDGDTALAYYVGFDYQVNQSVPIYFRLLQLVIECAIDMGCRKISFGRTACEPKASLGAKPVEAHVWVRHRVPVVNFFIRQLLQNIPLEDAPERRALKS